MGPLLKYTGHIKEHFDNEKHVYALDIETQTTWDFSREDYVWRII